MALLFSGRGSAEQSSNQPGGPPPGQQSAVTFRSEVGIVEIDAVVTDDAGRFVPDLARDDFELYEDGRRRQFSLFSLVNTPIPRSQEPAAAEPDVRTLAQTQQGRVYVLVLDDLHTAPLRTPLLKAAARRFVETYFYPGDLAAVVYTGPGQGAGQTLTPSKRLLLAAIERFRGQQIDPASDGRLASYQAQQLTTDDQDQSASRLDDPNDSERSFNARRTLNALKGAATGIGLLEGRRKSVLFFSEGIDYDISDVFSSRGATGVLLDLRESIAAASRSNVSIYAVDPRGLGGLSDEYMKLLEPQTYTRTAREQLGTRGLEQDLRAAQDSLRTLAEQTGGLSLVDSADFTGGFERLVRDTSTYYVLGYYPQAEGVKDGFHKIQIRVQRPGLHVRARGGYFRPEDRQAHAVTNVLLDALASPVPAGNLPMAVFAAPFRGADGRPSVVVVAEVAGTSLQFAQQGELFQDGLRFSLAALGTDGRVRESDAGNIMLAVKPDVGRQIVRSGVRFLSRIALSPDRYQLRVAATETGGGAASVVHADLEVPDFSRQPLSMSGLLLTTASAADMATPRGDAALQRILPAPPTATRTFSPGEVLAVYAEIYENISNNAHVVDVTTSVNDATGAVVFSSHEERRGVGQSPTTLVYGAEVPLKALGAGAYTLRVEARSRLGEVPAVLREIPFRVRPAMRQPVSSDRGQP